MTVDEAELTRRLHAIRLVVTDVDGVLTDAGMYYSEQGDELKKFNTRDGNGIGRLHAAGLRVAIVTGETTRIVARRAAKLRVKHVYQGVADKAVVLEELQQELDVKPEEIAYVGDDLNDMPVRHHVGLLFVVADACKPLREAADVVLERKGGEGAVREVADLILSTRIG